MSLYPFISYFQSVFSTTERLLESITNNIRLLSRKYNTGSDGLADAMERFHRLMFKGCLTEDCYIREIKLIIVKTAKNDTTQLIAVLIIASLLYRFRHVKWRLPNFLAPFDFIFAAKRRMVFLKSIFAALAKLAKSDSVIKNGEEEAIEKIAHKLELSSKEYEKMINYYNEILFYDKRSLYDHLSAFTKQFKHDRVTRMLFLRLLFTVMSVQNFILPKEEAILRKIAISLEILPAQYNSLLSQFSLKNKSSATGWQSWHPKHKKYYDLLGVSPMCSDEELKQAYRSFALENHPDKLFNKGIPPKAQKLAHEHFVKIQKAYEQIRETRGIK